MRASLREELDGVGDDVFAVGAFGMDTYPSAGSFLEYLDRAPHLFELVQSHSNRLPWKGFAPEKIVERRARLFAAARIRERSIVCREIGTRERARGLIPFQCRESVLPARLIWPFGVWRPLALSLRWPSDLFENLLKRTGPLLKRSSHAATGRPWLSFGMSVFFTLWRNWSLISSTPWIRRLACQP